MQSLLRKRLRILVLAIGEDHWQPGNDFYQTLENTTKDIGNIPFFRPLEAGQETRPEQFFPVDVIVVFGCDPLVLAEVMSLTGARETIIMPF